MILEGRPENCFSSTHVLKLNGQAIGKIEGRFFSEGLDLALTGRKRLRLDKAGWLTSHFQLKDAESDAVLVEARPMGIFSSGWDLQLTCGKCELRKSGFFSSSYDVRQDAKMLATVEHLGFCERGWKVTKFAEQLAAPDLILVGLIYHIIVKRQHQHAAAAGAHGS
jgi:hypothetical protein